MPAMVLQLVDAVALVVASQWASASLPITSPHPPPRWTRWARCCRTGVRLVAEARSLPARSNRVGGRGVAHRRLAGDDAPFTPALSEGTSERLAGDGLDDPVR